MSDYEVTLKDDNSEWLARPAQDPADRNQCTPLANPLPDHTHY